MTTVARNIAAIRRQTGLSQAAFGELLGATRTQVSNWERGRTVPGIDTLYRLAQMAGTSADRLHTSESPSQSIRTYPEGFAGMLSVEQEILQELKKINDQLGDIRQMIAGKLPD